MSEVKKYPPPAAAAQRLTSRLAYGVALSILLAVAETWAGIALAYGTDWPPTFWITTLSGGVYLVSLAIPRARPVIDA